MVDVVRVLHALDAFPDEGAYGEVSTVELAEHLAWPVSRVAHALNRLFDKGLVNVDEWISPEDHAGGPRTTTWYVTPMGEDALRGADVPLSGRWERVVSSNDGERDAQ